MIGSGSALLDNANFTPRFLRHAREHEQKIFATDAASATACKEDSAPLQQPNCTAVQSMVRHQGLVCTPTAASEFGGVQNHGTVLFALFDERVERLKSIARFEPDTFESVELGVSPRLRNGFFAAVDAEDFCRAAEGCRNHREAAGVAKHVEDAAARHVLGGGKAVFPLVEIEARLLAGVKVDFVGQAVFADDEWLDW
jgi:hypothetical protein